MKIKKTVLVQIDELFDKAGGYSKNNTALSKKSKTACYAFTD